VRRIVIVEDDVVFRPRDLRARGDRTPISFHSAFWRDAATCQPLQGPGVAHLLSTPVEMDTPCRQVEAVLERRSAPPAEG
jgi:hypothetical protein